jgi:hypothetical protein
MTQHTKGPWIQLTGRKDHVHISNTTGPHWSAPDHYVAEVTEQNAVLVKGAPLMLAALREVYRLTAFCFQPTARDIAIGAIAEQVLKAVGETPTIETVEGDQSLEELLKHYGGAR